MITFPCNLFSRVKQYILNQQRPGLFSISQSPIAQAVWWKEEDLDEAFCHAAETTGSETREAVCTSDSWSRSINLSHQAGATRINLALSFPIFLTTFWINGKEGKAYTEGPLSHALGSGQDGLTVLSCSWAKNTTHFVEPGCKQVQDRLTPTGEDLLYHLVLYDHSCIWELSLLSWSASTLLSPAK